MKKVEKINSGDSQIAIIVRKDVRVNGIKFFTKSQNPFQLGLHIRKKGVVLAPHVHVLKNPIEVNSIQEILFIQKGKIRLSLYDTKNQKIAQKILRNGDTVLLMEGGHGVEILEDARIFEVKQGPYPGFQKAKLYLK